MNRREAVLKISYTDISIVNGSLWKVKSQTSDQHYIVSKTAELCCYDHCYHKCLTITCMELCEHLYTCNCPDFNRMCKHIHKIQSFTNRSSFQQYSNNSRLSDTNFHSPETPLMNDNHLQKNATSPSSFSIIITNKFKNFIRTWMNWKCCFKIKISKLWDWHMLIWFWENLLFNAKLLLIFLLTN